MNWLFELHKTQPVAHAIGIVQKKAIMPDSRELAGAAGAEGVA